MRDEDQATVYGLISAAMLTDIPPWVLSYTEKLLYGAALALLSGFTYKAGGWVWDAMTTKWSKRK